MVILTVAFGCKNWQIDKTRHSFNRVGSKMIASSFSMDISIYKGYKSAPPVWHWLHFNAAFKLCLLNPIVCTFLTCYSLIKLSSQNPSACFIQHPFPSCISNILILRSLFFSVLMIYIYFLQICLLFFHTLPLAKLLVNNWPILTLGCHRWTLWCRCHTEGPARKDPVWPKEETIW